jgi:hypothetical protein
VQAAWVQAENRCQVWVQVQEEGERVTWSGRCENGFAEGVGVLQGYQAKRPTDRYDGEVRNGKPHGYGVLTRRNGERYEGQWRDGKADGLGHITLKSGASYSLIWLNGCAKLSAETVIAVGTNASTCRTQNQAAPR